MKIQRLSLVLGVLVSACATASESDLCNRVARFADAVPLEKTHEVTIRTDWSAEPTVTCTRDDSAAARTLCEWLPLHVSIEFMKGNVARVLRCFSRRTRLDVSDVASLAGTIRIDEPRRVEKKVWIELEFSTTGKDGTLPFLTIRSGHRD